MKKTLKLLAYVLPFFLMGSMVSCGSDDDEDQESVIYHIYLDGAYLEDGNNNILVFDGNGTFKSYENDWLYTADIESYSYGTWNYGNGTLTITYIGKYEDGTSEGNFRVSTKSYTFTNYTPTTQAIGWTTENGKTVTFQKYVRTSVEQYLKTFLVGKWTGEGIWDLEVDGTFTITINSIKEYGDWSVSEEILTFIIKGYYDVNTKVPYDAPKIVKGGSVKIVSADEMEFWIDISSEPTLDQGGGGQAVSRKVTLTRTRN